MRRTKILNAEEARRKPFSEAKYEFLKHCRLKNLRPRTIAYYEEAINYFRSQVAARYVDEITQEKFDDFIIEELDKGKKITSLNAEHEPYAHPGPSARKRSLFNRKQKKTALS